MGFSERVKEAGKALINGTLDNIETTSNKNAKDKKNFNEEQREGWASCADLARGTREKFKEWSMSTSNAYEEDYKSDCNFSQSKEGSKVVNSNRATATESNRKNGEYATSFNQNKYKQEEWQKRMDYVYEAKEREEERRQREELWREEWQRKMDSIRKKNDVYEKKEKEREIWENDCLLTQYIYSKVFEKLWENYGSIENVKTQQIDMVQGLLRLRCLDKVIAVVSSKDLRKLVEGFFETSKMNYYAEYSSTFIAFLEANKDIILIDIIKIEDLNKIAVPKEVRTCEKIKHRLRDKYWHTIIQNADINNYKYINLLLEIEEYRSRESSK